MVDRFLVTTALEKTWPANDAPILFLGVWCRLYDKKTEWEKRDAVVAPYHWDDREKLHEDYLYLQTLYEELLSELAIKLNVLHGVNHSVRYWRIIVGPWLGYFIQILFDRWAMLQQVVRENDISGVRVLQRLNENYAPNAMADFIPMFLSDDWNELIYGQLLAWMQIPVEKVDAGVAVAKPIVNAPKLSFRRQAKHVLGEGARRIFAALCRSNEYFFISTYLPIKQDLLLQLKLGQIPKLWRSAPAPVTPINSGMRQWQWVAPATAENFSAIVRAMIPRHIPVAYLEGYRETITVTESLPWPKRPRAIFTSTSFVVDDVFKIWAAAKVEQGVALITGQHGGNYGMALWNFIEEHQTAVSDLFLTWGWRKDGHKNIIPIGNLKGFGNSGCWDKEGVALLVEAVAPRTSYHMYSIPVAGQLLSYLDDQYRFVEALPQSLRDKVIVRLRAEDYGWRMKQRWRDHFPNMQLDDGLQSMESLVKKSRLYISTYNATTYLESMSLNIPTIMFWNPKHWELRDSAIPYFEQLKSVGIFHDTPESAARQMAAVWDDVSGWWESAAVQAVRREFCEQYAHLPEKPLDVMEKLFRKIADKHHAGI